MPTCSCVIALNCCLSFSFAVKAAGAVCTLLYKDGSYFCGPMDEQHRPHGEGAFFSKDGKARAKGQWEQGAMWAVNGRVQDRTSG